MFVLVTGNAFDGLTLHGPFSDTADAVEYYESHDLDYDWTIIHLEPTT